ncbi:MAG: TatD family hydrolase [Coriobacteriales bacterium]|jgi:TatD DNase family protein|nr:TatD family hydrolase [Coriobacteriales bacterium]
MRTPSSASCDATNKKGEQEIFWDALFRDTKGRVIAPPDLTRDIPTADTHVHLDMLRHPALALARSRANSVEFLVAVVDPTENPAYTYNNLADWEHQARELLEEWHLPPHPPRTRIIVGCHPHNAAKLNREVERTLIRAAARPITAGIGEIGLDYHYELSPRKTQREAFRRQLALANEMMLPVALHLRDAHEDGLAILREEGMPQAGTLLHCFNLDYETLAPFLALGCQVAFGGALTFEKSDEVRAAAARTPRRRIVTETDAPFMAPRPLRGTVCGPEDVVFTAACLAEVFGVTGLAAKQLLNDLYENARMLFDRDTTVWQDNKGAMQALLNHAKGVV